MNANRIHNPRNIFRSHSCDLFARRRRNIARVCDRVRAICSKLSASNNWNSISPSRRWNLNDTFAWRLMISLAGAFADDFFQNNCAIWTWKKVILQVKRYRFDDWGRDWRWNETEIVISLLPPNINAPTHYNFYIIQPSIMFIFAECLWASRRVNIKEYDNISCSFLPQDRRAFYGEVYFKCSANINMDIDEKWALL